MCTVKGNPVITCLYDMAQMTLSVIKTTRIPRCTPGGLLVSNPYSLKHI